MTESSLSLQKPKGGLAGWIDGLRAYRDPAVLRMLFLGFSAGLPIVLVMGTLGFWLRRAGIDRATIGYLSWVGMAYGFKWAWAPLVDRVPLPLLYRWLGRRRSWLLLSQILIAVGLVGMAMVDPESSLDPIVWFALLVAFSSATQDIALDAYRIECAPSEKQAALAASYQAGYRLAMIWAGAGALWIVVWATGGAQAYDFAAWRIAYFVMAASMVTGLLTVLLSPEPEARPLPPARSVEIWLRTTLLEPFADFFRRYAWQAAVILGLIAIYKISDVVMGTMASPFYADMGFTEDEVATVSKLYGLIMTLLGGFLGGILAIRLGVMKVLFLGAVLSSATNLLFAWLAGRGHDFWGLVGIISADNLSSGIASAGFVAYLSSLTSVQYSATQYALLSSVMQLLPKYLGGFSGAFVNAYGYETYFAGTALLGIPVLVLVWLAARLAAGTRTPRADQRSAEPS